MKYEKWVRDKIPEIITKSGSTSLYEIVSDMEILEKYFKRKVEEELTEIIDSGFSEEEFADLIEVIESAIILSGKDLSTVRNIQQKKAKERGSFKNNIILKETSD